jgi:transcription elongation factor Elf1
MDHKTGTGSLACRLCGATFQMPIHHLNEPIDVFSEWLDECEAAQNPNSAAPAAAGGGSAPTQYDDDDDDDEDDLPESSGLGQRKAIAKPSARLSNQNNDNARSIDLGDENSDDDE